MISGISSVDSVFWTIFWQSTLFLLIGLVISIILRNHSARAHRILLLSIIASVFVPAMTILVKHLGLGIFEAKTETIKLIEQEPVLENSIEPYVFAPTEMILQPEFANVETPLLPEPEEEIVKAQSIFKMFVIQNWRSILLFGWIAISVILTFRLLVTFLLGIRLLNKAEPLESKRITKALQLAKEKLAIKKDIELYGSRKIKSPVIWCWRVKPVLVVPKDAEQFHERIDWTGVLCHELAHWKRRDHICGLIAELAACILPWQILLWLTKTRLINLSEHACDDWVIATGKTGTDYAESLLDMTPGGQMAFVPAVVRNKNGLAARVQRILMDSCGNPRTGFLWAVAACIIACSIAVTVAFAQTRPPKPEPVIDANDNDVTTISENQSTSEIEINEQIFEVRNWDTGDMVELLNVMIKDKIRNSPSSYFQNDSITLIPYPEKYWIIARAPNEAMKFIEEWIIKLNSENSDIFKNPSLSEIEDKNQVAQKIYHLVYSSPSHIADKIKPLLSDTGYLSAEENTGTILVRDKVSVLLEIEIVINNLDKEPEPEIYEKYFEVKNREPYEIVQSLQILFKDRISTNQITLSPIWVTHQPDKNWIIAKASAEDMMLIQSWIAKLDRKDSYLPESWSLYYDSGVQPDGSKRWPANMAENLASLEIKPRPIDAKDYSWKNERFEFRIYSLDGTGMGNIYVRQEPELKETNRRIFQPGVYLIRYEREYGTSETNYRMRCENFLLDMSQPGMYELFFAPKLGYGEISGSAGGCYAVNFERIGSDFPLSGLAYLNRQKEYRLDGLPNGTYRLSAVSQQNNGNVVVSQSQVTIKDEEKVTLDIAPPLKGDCSLTGSIFGKQNTYTVGSSTNPIQSKGEWFVLLRNFGTGKVTATNAYEAITMDSKYVIRGSENIVQETPEKANFKIDGIAPGEYNVTVIEKPNYQGVAITRQQSKLLIISEGKKAVLDFDFSENKDHQVSSEPLISIQTSGLNLYAIKELLTTWTGKEVIASEEAKDLTILIYTPEKITKSNAVNLIYNAIRKKGFVVEETEDSIYIKHREDLLNGGRSSLSDFDRIQIIFADMETISL